MQLNNQLLSRSLKPLSLTLKKMQAQKLQREGHYDWQQQARPEQRTPRGLWRLWLIMAGRGFGKTRTGAESVRHWVMKEGYRRIALVGQSEADVRQIMIEGESGILNIHPHHERPIYEPSRRLLRWPNGAIATAYSAENYEQLRGPQFDAAWVDELAKFRYPQETWDQLNMALRLGNHPRVIVTTTPRPIPILKFLSSVHNKETIITRGSTYDNKANLSPHYIQFIRNNYEHSPFSRQEIYGDIINDSGQTLWNPSLIAQIQRIDHPPLQRIVVAIDPAVTNHNRSDETGIIVAGRDENGHAYVLDDLSGRYSCEEWAHRALEAYHHYQADVIVAEVNKGGDLVQEMLRAIDGHVSYKGVYASRSKLTRAEPIAALYRQGKVFHITQGLHELEKQLCTYTVLSKLSPDRLDALVWALTELMLERNIPDNLLKCWSPFKL